MVGKWLGDLKLLVGKEWRGVLVYRKKVVVVAAMMKNGGEKGVR